jgi:ferritin-like metal-binding protein YciE
MEMDTLKELYVDELKDIWSAEKQIIRALPRMIRAATEPELKKAFTKHLKETEGHVSRLEKIFTELDESPRGKKCIGMEGVLEEGSELIKDKPEQEVLDVGLIAKAQHVEHYEMAAYGTLRTWALALGFERQAELLEMTLGEEKQTDADLTALAESSINIEAEV